MITLKKVGAATCLFVALIAPGCGRQQATTSIAPVAEPNSPEFRKAQVEADQFHQQRQLEEAKQRSRVKRIGSH